MTTTADCTAEPDAALLLLREINEGNRPIAVVADKAHNTNNFVKAVRDLKITPHVSPNNKNWRSVIDRRTTRHGGYRRSLSKRWLVERAFGWLKQAGPTRKVKFRGLPRVGSLFLFSCTAYN
jgi:transposase